MQNTEPSTSTPSATTASPLAYAPPQRSHNRVFAVLFAGLFTTALALFGVWLLNAKSDESIMGWYANYVIPAGAILVGLIAGAGYGIMSWITGVKIRKGLLWTIVGLQVWAYFAAQYIEFKSMGPMFLRSTGEQLTFRKYYHFQAITFAWKSKDGKPGEPLGNWGYVFRLLEIIGFVGGGIIVPAVMMAAPYCELCEAYMKTRHLALIPGSTKGKFIGKKKPEQQEEDKVVLEAGAQTMSELGALIEAGDGSGFGQKVAQLAPQSKAAGKLPVRYRVSMVVCKQCSNGIVRCELVAGQGNQTNVQKLAETHVSRDFVNAAQAGGAI